MAFGDAFLRHPDLFPARRFGDPWGEETLVIDFAGGPYRFTGLTTAQKSTLAERFGDMAGDGLPPGSPEAVPIPLFRAPAAEFKPVDLDGWSYTFDRRYLEHAVEIAGLDFMARVDWRPGLLGALWTPLDGGPFFRSQVENFFRLLVAYRLLELGGVLFHSAGVVSGERSFLFLGPSGAGKTTISKLSLATGREVLSDDMNALCPPPDGGPVRLEKLPFAGDLGNQPGKRRSFPLAAFCRLRQGEHGLKPLRAAESVAFLVGCAPFINADPHRLDALTDNLLDLVRSLPAYELSFAKDGGFWPLLEGECPAQ
ncbi:MAG: hypothetical protein AAFY88_02780 [Acidobacteriota bacterium]